MKIGMAAARAALAAAFAVAAPRGYAATEGDYTYTVASGKATITAFNAGYKGALSLPASLGGYPVAAIGNGAFSGCAGLTSAAIPAGVTAIGAGPFARCAGLTNIAVATANPAYSGTGGVLFNKAGTALIQYPGGKAGTYTVAAGVTDIGEAAFAGCAGLTGISVAAANPAYSGTGGVLFNKTKTSLIQHPGGKSGAYVVPAGVTNIGSAAFAWCDGLTSVTLPDSVTAVGANAFRNCPGLTFTFFSGNAPAAGASLFTGTPSSALVYYVSGATGWGTTYSGRQTASCAYTVSKGKATLTDFSSAYAGPLAIPDTLAGYPLAAIGESAFEGCSSLTSATIPESVTAIGESAFQTCTGLTSVRIPAGVTAIVDRVFFGCESLASVTLPEGVTAIGDASFAWCSALAAVTVPGSLDAIGNETFRGCSSLTYIFFGGDEPAVSGGDIFRDCPTETALLYYVSGAAGWGTDWGRLLTARCSYTVAGGKATMTLFGSDYQGALSVPDALGGYPLAAIGDAVFEGNFHLTSVTLPGGVTNIGTAAFRNCTGLTNATLPAGVAVIGNQAFQGCAGLTSMALPENVTAVGTAAFAGCSGLTNAAVAAGAIGNSAFSDCTGLRSVALGGGVTAVGTNAFARCTGLTALTVPDSVAAVGDQAFQGCSVLRSFFFAGNAPAAGVSMFAGCHPNARVYFMEGTSGWEGTYGGRQTAPCTYAVAGGQAAITGFNTAYAGTFSFPATLAGHPLTAIGDAAFEGCANLTSVTIPAGVTAIGAGPFARCGSLTGIAVAPANPAYSGAAGVLFDKAGTALVQYPGGKAGAYIVPAGVTAILNRAFYRCAGLTSVTIPAGVTTIGNEAFNQCSGLASVTLPASVAAIGDEAFARCTGLTTGFIVSPANSAYSGAAGVLFNKAGTVLVQYPGGRSGAYAVPPGTASIRDWAFRYCAGLTSVTTPASLGAIGDQAFYQCSGLTNAVIAAGAIGDDAFNGCGNLQRAALGDGVTAIGARAFDHCSGLTSVAIPGSVTNIGNEAFDHCSGLTSLTIPGSVATIGSDAFHSCTGLTNAVVAAGAVGDRAFQSCSSLASVTLGESVAAIGGSAFLSCTGLTSVFFKGNAPSLGPGVFSDTPATVYHVSGTAGWGASFGGRPTAVWTSTATFSAGEGTASFATRAYNVGNPYGELPTATRAGFDFEGWHTQAEGGTTVTAGTTVPYLTAGHTLHARWAPSPGGGTTATGVPFAWLDARGLVTGGDYEAAALADTDGDGHLAWQEYVAGTEPTNAASLFTASIAVSNGAARVAWTPDLPDRVYTVEGKPSLPGGGWSSPTNASTRFFRVRVSR